MKERRGEKEMLHRKGKYWFIMILLCLTIGMMAGCSKEGNSSSKSDGDQVELRMVWWGSQDRHDRTLKVIDQYMEENPHVTISPEFTGWDGYWEKMATQAAGGNLPDIVQMDYKYLSEYVLEKDCSQI